MKTFFNWKYLALCLISINAMAIGGKIGNGGGGDVNVKMSAVPIGHLGKLMELAVSLNDQEIVRDIKVKYTSLNVSNCEGLSKNNEKVYLEVPASISHLVHIKMLKKPEGLLGWFLNKEPQVVELDMNYVCTHPGWLSSYNDLVSTLIEIENEDIVGNFLLRKVNEKGGRQEFVVSGFQFNSETVENNTHEFTIFNHEQGVIQWGARSQKKGLSALLSRSHLSFMRHELMHALLWRVYGGSYPKISKWHDYKAYFDTENCQRGFFGKLPNKSCWWRFETSQAAAFIEGLAFAVEAGSSLEHPYLETDIDSLIYD
ncbi:MAG: hypothetical protein KDD40_11895, partial [Bdellovibrionales bacterium]|nr:hypothetical protein [Bdellovibrionales bacterium]